MKATSTQIQDLQQDITSLDRTLSRHPNEHTALNLKGCKLIELAKALNNPSYYDEALICFNEAIRLTNEENDVYLMDRSKLYGDMRDPESAVIDIKKAGKVPVKTGGVLGLFVEHTIEYVARLESVQTTLGKLAASGNFDPELIRVLQVHAKLTEVLFAITDRHEDNINQLNTQVALVTNIVQKLVSGQQVSNTQINDISIQVNDIKQDLTDQGIDINKLINDATISGMTAIAEIKQGFEALEKQSQSPELYAYCKTFYWTSLNLLLAYRSLSSGLIKEDINNNQSKGDVLANGAMKVMHYGAIVGSAIPVPFAAGIIGLLDAIIDDIYNVIKVNQFENKVNIINKIMQKFTLESDIAISIGKTALNIIATPSKKQAILTPQIPNNNNLKGGIDWIQEKLVGIKDTILPSVKLHDPNNQAVKLALQDVTLLIAYLCNNQAEILSRSEALDLQMESIVTHGNLDQLLINVANSTAVSQAAKITEQLACFSKIESAIGQKTLKIIEEKAAKGKWISKTHMREHVKKYQEEKYIKELKNKGLVTTSEEVKICVLKHICEGINSSPKMPKNINCLGE